MRQTPSDQLLRDNCAATVRKRHLDTNVMMDREKGTIGGIDMRRAMRLVLVLAIAMVLTGCQGRFVLNLDLPIVVEPARPPYRAETWGYLSYNPRDHHIVYTIGRNSHRSYQPLRDAKVTIVGTGLTVHTDHDGYFYLSGVPHGRLTLLVQHRRVGPSNGVYIQTTSR